MRTLAGLFVFTSCWAFGQATAARPAFDVAEVRLNKSGDSDGFGSILLGGQCRTVNMPLNELILAQRVCAIVIDMAQRVCSIVIHMEYSWGLRPINRNETGWQAR
jgi:hypothetical protein